MSTLRRFLDWLLGPRCPYDCGQRVFTADVPHHVAFQHGRGKS